MSRRGDDVKAPTLDKAAATRSRDSRRKISAGAPHKKERGGDQSSSQAAAPACNASSLCYSSSRQRIGFSLSGFLRMCSLTGHERNAAACPAEQTGLQEMLAISEKIDGYGARSPPSVATNMRLFTRRLFDVLQGRDNNGRE